MDIFMKELCLQHRSANELPAASVMKCKLQRRTAKLPHSPLIPADLITSVHFTVSSTIILPNSAELIFIGTPPCSSSFFTKAGEFSTVVVSACTREMTAAGVAFGANMPHQM